MAKGYVALVLHAHLPFIRHPEDEFFLEERWLYEAITETYIPLIEALQRCTNEQIPFKITLSVSPPLVNMLNDALLQQRYIKHLNNMLELAEKEVQRTDGSPHQQTALMYQKRLRAAQHIFCHCYHGNLNQAFKKFQDHGCLELITCAATHGYLPFMYQHEAIYAQIEMAVSNHRINFGRTPKGIWLPECAYVPGLDEILKEFGIKFFFTDSHALMFASPRPKYSIYAPVFTPSGVAAFGRDIESSKQVWSAHEGYPGDVDYREYYRDIGYDLDEEYMWSYMHPDGIKHNTGFKYYRITGDVDLAAKEPYIPAWAENKVQIHAANFIFNREKQIEYLSGHMDRDPIIVAPYDAELFGHWWYEGPYWLEAVIRKANESPNIALISPADYLDKYPKNQVTTPCQSSWGKNGYHEVWLCPENDWIYRHLHEAAERMVELANHYQDYGNIHHRALNQAARELMLAQASDWAFIMNTGTTVCYANRRTIKHLDNFLHLYEMIKNNAIDEGKLSPMEASNNIFPHLDYRVFRTRHNQNSMASNLI